MTKKSPSKRFDLLKLNTPLVFADGTEVYKEFKKKYITHKIGYFILAPSGAGKTHFVINQKEPHWIDGDEVWMSARAHPDNQWWLEPLDVINEIDQRSDIITVKAKKIKKVTGHRNWIAKWKKQGVPSFKSMEEATEFLEKKLIKN